MKPADFLRAIFEHGRVRVAEYATISLDDWAAVDAVIVEWETSLRLEFPGEPPPIDIRVGRWAVERFYRACQFAVYRDVDAATVDSVLGEPVPVVHYASLHYSVDLIFRFLPELYRIAWTASTEDPLCRRLRKWADQWPLSSVGIAGVNPSDVSSLCDHAGLLRSYVDRIIARQDDSRLAEPRVRAAVQAALGHYRELASQMAAVLEKAAVPEA